MRPEKKSVALMKDTVRIFSQPDHVVVDSCPGTFITVKSSIYRR